MRRITWKSIQVIVLIAILSSVGHSVWKASQPRILASFRQFGGLSTGSHDGDGRAGGFTVNRWECRQWFREHEFIALTGCVVAARPITSIEQGSRITSGSSVVWHASIHTEGSEAVSTKTPLEIAIEYDMIRQTATLLNTGERLPFSPERVYTVMVDDEFQIERFVALDPEGTPSGLSPKLAENFSQVMGRRHEIRDGVGAGKQ